MLLLIAAAVAGGFGYWMWTQADEKLRQAIVARQQELAPEWDVEIPRAHFDWNRRVHIYDVTIKAKGQAAPVLRLPEIIVTIDRERFRQSQEVVVQKIRLINPEVHLTRDSDGRWNWQDLLTLPPSDRPVPEWEVEQGRVVVQLEHADARPASVIATEPCNLRLVPEAKRQYAIIGDGQINAAGQLAVRGRWHVDERRWNIEGEMHGVSTSGELLRLAAGASAELRDKLRRINAALDRYVAATQESTSRLPGGTDRPTDGVSGASPARQAGAAIDGPWHADDVVPDFGLRSTLDMSFRVAQTDPESEPDFRMAVQLRDGRIDHAALPFPVRDLAAAVDWDNRQIVLRRLTAKNGVTQLSISGRFERQAASVTPGQIDVRVSKLVLDERLRSRLPPLLGRQFDFLQPSGHADAEVTCVYDGAGQWTYRGLNLTALGCASTNQRFPYPVTGVVGTVRQEPDGDFIVQLEGRAGRRPVVVTGVIRQPGPAAEARFDVRVSKLAMDDRFREACPATVRKSLAVLRAEGWLDAAVRLHRPPGLDQPFRTDLALELHDCSIEVEDFPYRVSGLTGFVDYDGATKIWSFSQLRGRHGDATLTAWGFFRQDRTPASLDLQVVARNAHLDNELERALPESLRRVWADLAPAGRIDHLEARIGWTPDEPLRIAVPLAEISDGSLTLAAFPWRLADVKAQLSYADDRVEILMLDGRNDETRVWTGRADGPPTAFAIAEPDGGWQVRFEDLHIDDLTPDRRWRETLPQDLRSIVEELNPRGQPLSIAGMVHLRGGREVPIVTAAWDLGVNFTGGTLNVGTELKDLHGRVTTTGTWDGRRADLRGELDLDSVYVLDYQLTRVRGPFRVVEDRIEFGSVQALYAENPSQLASIAARNQITASAIGGNVAVNGTARLGPRTTYQLRASLRDGRLEQYARQYGSGARNLAGVMSADVLLEGRGPNPDDLTGRGGLRISPAALYELPIIARVLASLNTLAPPDRAAFKYADVEFDIAQSQFRFRRIDLVGDALSLRGRGSVGFDGQVRLDFYSMMARTRLPIGAIPGVNAILGEATKGWVGVRVRGRTSDPQTEPTYVPVLDDTLRNFLKAFEGAPPGMAPRAGPRY
ncbi:MAG TPA: hypothetical protein VML55_15490 [Planctomycetaceae bacterium]|nr:hypothetical protein [Planctomycetaceae bacterium]